MLTKEVSHEIKQIAATKLQRANFSSKYVSPTNTPKIQFLIEVIS